MSAQFFDAIRPLFRRGKMNSAQVTGVEQIAYYGRSCGYPKSHTAYGLATAFHEVGQRMQPIREGFATTDAGARRAVAGLLDKGIISRNYALPHKNGLSYYGRGLLQITHGRNYRKFGIYDNPEQALEMQTALDIMFNGMRDGMFRKGKSFDVLPEDPTLKQFVSARGIINGDVRKNGTKVAKIAMVFYKALENYYVKW